MQDNLKGITTFSYCSGKQCVKKNTTEMTKVKLFSDIKCLRGKKKKNKSKRNKILQINLKSS